MTPNRGRLLACLRCLSRLAPPWQRDAWLREWSAEVEYARSARLAPTTIGAAAHVLWLWRRQFQLDSIGADARYGFRALLRRPAFTLTAIGTLAVGAAATTTLATIISGVLLKPLPFPESDRLVRVSETRAGAAADRHPVLVRETLLAWRDHSTTLTSLAGYSPGAATSRTDVSQTGDRVRVVGMTANLFATLGVRPAVGTGPAPDAQPGDRAVWLSDTAWLRHYERSPVALGRPFWIDGETYRVAGVMAPDFAFPDRDTIAWIVGADVRFLDAVGRLRPGMTAAQAADEGTARSRTTPGLGQLGIAVFGSNGPPRVIVVPLLSAFTESARPSLLLLFAAVALLFATGVANVASLQLAHAASRRREFAIRSALGAGSTRTVRQLVVEHAIVGAAGAAVAVILTIWWNRLLPDWLPDGFPRATEVSVDARTLLLTLALSLGASQAFGLLPLWFVRRVRLSDAMAEDGTAPAGGGLRTHSGRLRAAILAAQVGAATLLLVGAALLGRSLFALTMSDRGYELSQLLTAQLPMPQHDFARLERVAALDDVIARMEQVPGVTPRGGKRHPAARAAGVSSQLRSAARGVNRRAAAGEGGFALGEPKLFRVARHAGR